MPKTYQDFIGHIVRLFPDALVKALNEHDAFTENGPPEADEKDKAKTVYEYNRACRAIIARMELMIRLANILKLPDLKLPDSNQQMVLSGLLQQAREEVKRFYDETGEGDE